MTVKRPANPGGLDGKTVLRLQTGAGRARQSAPGPGDFDLAPPTDYVVADWIRYKQRLDTLPTDDPNVAKARAHADRMIAFLSTLKD